MAAKRRQLDERALCARCLATEDRRESPGNEAHGRDLEPLYQHDERPHVVFETTSTFRSRKPGAWSVNPGANTCGPGRRPLFFRRPQRRPMDTTDDVTVLLGEWSNGNRSEIGRASCRERVESR